MHSDYTWRGDPREMRDGAAGTVLLLGQAGGGHSTAPPPQPPLGLPNASHHRACRLQLLAKTAACNRSRRWLCALFLPIFLACRWS